MDGRKAKKKKKSPFSKISGYEWKVPNFLIYCWPKPIFIVTRYLCNQECPRTGGLDLVFFTIYSQESTTAFVTCWWRIIQLGKVKMSDSSKPQGTTKLYTSYFFNQTKYFRNASLCLQGYVKYHHAACVKFSGFIVNAEGGGSAWIWSNNIIIIIIINFIYIVLISWAHGASQCKKGENEVIYRSQKILKIYLLTIIILQVLKS